MAVVDKIVLQIEVGGSLLSVFVTCVWLAMFHIPEEISKYVSDVPVCYSVKGSSTKLQ